MAQDVKYWPEWGPVIPALNLDAPSHWKQQAGGEAWASQGLLRLPKAPSAGGAALEAVARGDG